MNTPLSILAINGIPDIQKDDSIADIIIQALESDQIRPEEFDIFTIAHKIISKSEGRIVDMRTVEPGPEAREYAEKLNKENLLLLPENPDRSALEISERLSVYYNTTIGTIVTDTFGRPWRTGQVNVAIGLGNVPALINEKGNLDAYGKILHVTQPAFADEIAAASGLVVQKSKQTPVVLFRGLKWSKTKESINLLLRPDKEDVFK